MPSLAFNLAPLNFFLARTNAPLVSGPNPQMISWANGQNAYTTDPIAWARLHVFGLVDDDLNLKSTPTATPRYATQCGLKILLIYPRARATQNPIADVCHHLSW